MDDLVAAINLQIEPTEESDPVTATRPATEPPIAESGGYTRDRSDPFGDEDYDEDQDPELHTIFMDQLKEKYSAIRSLSATGESPERNTELLKSVLDHLQALRSAANYMGYDKLLRFYDDWIQNTSTAIAAVEAGDDPSMDFIRDRLQILEDRFPQIKPTVDEQEELETSPADTGSDEFDDVIETIFSTDNTGDATAVSDPEVDELFEDMDYEVYTEDLDQELFEIFLNHLTDSIRALWQESQRWSETSDPSEGLERSAGILDRLQSSANYMGYSQLRSIFAQWRDKVEASREMLASGEPVALDFWADYMDRIVKKFPNAEFCFDPEVRPDETADEMTLDNPPVVDPPVNLAVAEPELFDMLSNAFDDTASGLSDSQIDSFQEVIDEMITGHGFLPLDHFVPPGSPPERETNSPPSAAAPPLTGGKTVVPTESDRIPKPPEVSDAASETPQKKGQLWMDETKTPPGAKSGVGQKKFKQSVRVDADKIDYLMNQVGELVVSRAFFFQLFNDLRFLHQEMKENFKLNYKELKPLREFSFRLGEATVALGRVSNELQEGVMKVRMVPIAQFFSRYPRLVRDLVHNSNKHVKLETRGEDTELDKMIIEAISDPLIHIIRNAAGWANRKRGHWCWKPTTKATTSLSR